MLFDDFRLRTAQYMVVSGGTFGSPESEASAIPFALMMAGEPCLFENNTVYRPYQRAVGSDGRRAPDFRPYRYDYRGNRVVNNRLLGETRLRVAGAGASHLSEGAVTAEGNSFE